MRGGSILFFFIILAILLLIDAYAFRTIRFASGNLSDLFRNIVYIVYWLIPVFLVFMTIFIIINRDKMTVGNNYVKTFFPMMAVIVLFYVPKMVIIPFQLIEDLTHLTSWIIQKFTTSDTVNSNSSEILSRRHFIGQAGLILSVVPFLSAAHGILRGRYNYQVKNMSLYFKNLPPAFDGFRVLQISDWHIGSFVGNGRRIEDAVKLISEQKADLILFTGDLVNNIASEVDEFIPSLKKINAKYGVYSILGNHDYGEYVDWKSEEDWKNNMIKLAENQEKIGFKLLKNENVKIEKDNDQIAVIGLENWGLPPFPQYGDLAKAQKGTENIDFKILMSHDPSHWDAEVINKAKIDLTLSGHTHGMQFGINIPGIKWSPVKWKYPRWAGLYGEGCQKLYVNVGIGYIGFPGRIGFYPEITVFKLHRST